MPHHYIAVVAANFSTQRLQGDNVHQTIVGRSFVCFAVDTNFLEIVSLLCWAVLLCIDAKQWRLQQLFLIELDRFSGRVRQVAEAIHCV